MMYSVIDLGTNTFKLLVAEVDSLGQVSRKEALEVGVKLGEGGIEKKEISTEAFQRGIRAVGELINRAGRYYPEQIIVVATSGIRSSKNGIAFIEKIKELFELTVTVISGDEEAELIFRGVRQAVKLEEKPALILDIGGGSNEFIVGNKDGFLFKRSFDLGIARLLSYFNPSDPITNEETEKVYNYLENELNPLTDELSGYPIDTLIGCAGTFETYRSVLKAMDDQAVCENEPSFHLEMDKFRALYELLVFSDYKERSKIPGLQLFRVEMIVLATIFVNFIVEKFQIKHIIQSDFALKEGVLDQYINQ